MGRFVSTISVATALVVAGGACKKGDDDKKDDDNTGTSASKATEETPPEPEPEELTADKQQEIFDTCWSAWAERDKENLGSCYADDGTLEIVDAVPERKGSGDEIMSVIEQYWTAFPDIQMHPAFVAANGEKVAAFFTIEGTNEGELMAMPATGKKIALWSAQRVTMNPEGKVTSDRHWADDGTIMAQLGVSPNPMAPAADSIEHPTEVIRVTAKGDETEENNLALLKSLDEPMKNRDAEAMLAAYADDAEFRYSATGEVQTGHEALKKGLEEWFAMSEDMEVEVEDAWAAGDWVIAETRLKGTMAIDMPDVKVKTKGKSFDAQYLEFIQLADGKITKHYIFTNSAKWAADIGLFDPSKMPGGGEGGAKGAGEGGATKGGAAPAKKTAP